MKKFVITDIHGCKKTFEALLEKINFSVNDELYLLGDYIDRGPDSKGVIDLIWKFQQNNYKVHCLRGNHEQLMILANSSDRRLQHWIRNGGEATIRNFGKTFDPTLYSTYQNFMEKLPFFFEIENYILVHAGLNFELTDPMWSDHDLIWIRRWYDQINYDWLGNRIIVHGHTPIEKIEVERLHKNLEKNQYLNLDAGCVYKGKREGCGFLAAFDLTTKELYFQENIDF